MKQIAVDFCGWGRRWHLGTLADNGTDLLFEYSAEALRFGIELSPLHLKLRAQAYSGFPAHQHRLPGFIADALPDGWGMLLMDKLFAARGYGRHQISVLDRLAFIGERAMGALAFRPADGVRLNVEDLDLLALAQEVKNVVDDKDSAALGQLALLGGSPQGARPKVLVQYDALTHRISTSPTASGTPWLVKFQARGEHKEVCVIEHMVAHLARQCGLDMPATEYFDLDRKLGGFGIARFDRCDGMRVPIQTLAGYLNVTIAVPSAGYQELLRATRHLTNSMREVSKAFERCVFNVIFNNRDDHAKNFSFRMTDAFAWELAPCYDLTFSQGPGGEHQMDVMGEGRAPAKSHLLRLAAANDIPPGQALAIIERIAGVALDLGPVARAFRLSVKKGGEIRRAVEANCQRML